VTAGALQRLRHRVARPLKADERERVGAAVRRRAGVDGYPEAGEDEDHGDEHTCAHGRQSRATVLKEV
jgi:hypothetical protein